MVELHFLRPMWFWAILPVIGWCWFLLLQQSAVKTWFKICDPHLLQPLLVQRGRVNRGWMIITLFLSLFFMVLALVGPTWSKIAVPIYQRSQPRLIILDLSKNMWSKDLSPDRLTRAKFKIHDLLLQPHAGQFGLMVYSEEPFIVSPLTDDAQTIDTLLSSLTPDILPVDGNRLDRALLEATPLFSEIGMNFGDILVLTAQIPSPEAIDAARQIAAKGYHVSVMPLLLDKTATALFTPLAKAGRGELIAFKDNSSDIQRWLALSDRKSQYEMNLSDDIPLWRDEGRWFLLFGMVLLLPLFRRGGLERIKE